MATQGTPIVPIGGSEGAANAAVQRPWRMRAILSRSGDLTEQFLARSAFDRGPWLVVSFAAGIGTWFALASPWQWTAASTFAILVALAVHTVWRGTDDRSILRLFISGLGLAFAIGIVVIWARSEAIGAEAIARPQVMTLDARILEREEQPAEDRVRLVLATRDVEQARAIRVRINVPNEKDLDSLREGARVRLKARLMPPSPPVLPGAYDFARAAWFKGFAATGSLVGSIEVIEPVGSSSDFFASIQRTISDHVRNRLAGSSGTIAAAFASGDRGAIAQADEVAMRDAGLTHLLSISGLHVSAVIAAAYFLAIKLLAFFPSLALRVRLPVVAAAIAALAGIAYTLITGAQVPTVRSCVGAVLVLIALALGREPLSMRMLAMAAGIVLLLWPEALVGPSFQMSFSAVIAIIALHNVTKVREFLAPRDESGFVRLLRRLLMLFVTGLVIELALTPIVLFHFHRAGLYGAFANVFAIPLVTFIAMPLIALALLLDLVGAGAPVWWLAGQSLDLLLWIARITAAQPGAVKLLPHMGTGTLLVFVAGGLWLALWKGRARLLGLMPVLLGSLSLLSTPIPDLSVTRDAGNLGLVDNGRLYVLKYSDGSYAQDNIVQLSGVEATPMEITARTGVRCSPDFCAFDVERNNRKWHLLVARSKERIDERSLAAACERSDIVIADRWLPFSCHPRWLKVDRRFIEDHGGLSIFLADERIETVASGQGEQGWWQPRSRQKPD